MITLLDVSLIKGHATILNGITLTLPPKQIHTIIGPSGAGKTSLLRLINRLEEPTSGTLTYLGQSLSQFPVVGLRRRIALVFQQPVFFTGTVGENIAYPLYLQGRTDNALVRQCLGLVGIPTAWLDRDPQELSAGQRQRVALARTLVKGPEVLMLDEPTANLDPASAGQVEDTVRCLVTEQKLTVLWVTHDMAQARRVGHTTTLLIGGQVMDHRETPAFFTNPASLSLINSHLQEVKTTSKILVQR